MKQIKSEWSYTGKLTAYELYNGKSEVWTKGNVVILLECRDKCEYVVFVKIGKKVVSYAFYVLITARMFIDKVMSDSENYESIYREMIGEE